MIFDSRICGYIYTESWDASLNLPFHKILGQSLNFEIPKPLLASCKATGIKYQGRSLVTFLGGVESQEFEN